MELEKLIEKMTAPLIFAARDNYGHLTLVKNLEKVMLSLSNRLQETINSDILLSKQNKIREIPQQLLTLFRGYDTLKPKEKRDHIAEAIDHLSWLRMIVKNRHIISREGRALPVFEEGGNAFLTLSRPVDSLRGIGPRITEALAKKNLHTIEDLLYFLPRRYEDRRVVCRIDHTLPGSRQTILGTITCADIHFYGKKKIFEVTVNDGHGTLRAKWFKGRQAFLRGSFKPGRRIIVTGSMSGFPFERVMIHPDFEILDNNEDHLLHFKRIVPIYSETEGLHQKTLRRIMWRVTRDYTHLVQSLIPEAINRKRGLILISEAIRQAHFPDMEQDVEAHQKFHSEAHRSLVYDDLFFFQLGMAMKKRGQVLEKGISFRSGGELLKRFIRQLPFILTQAQCRVVKEIERDMESPRTMNRLLQGDVGSGKTVVSAAAIIIACGSGYQATMMAPTEILAEQHYRNLKNWLENIGLKTALLTGSVKSSERKNILQRMMKGNIDILVGTHALIQDGVIFQNLGLVVIDEQHRFGVAQRAALRRKGIIPDLLVTTATPIPRTLAMTVYGDLDVSVIDEMPPGKKAVTTKIFSENQRDRVYELIRREIQKRNQVFIVYPLVEESEDLSIKDASGMARHLQKEIFPDCRIGLIHGRLKVNDKNRIMTDFMKKRIQILVSTTVVEVGIDIPEASLMVIEHAERFGLSQLHQLRGRVGRSDIPSFCILLAQKSSSDARKRLSIMEESNDGFSIAEADLTIRGPGEFMGTRQSGLPDFRIADIVRDASILSIAREDAFALVDEDPLLERSDHLPIREELFRRWGGRLELARTG